MNINEIMESNEAIFNSESEFTRYIEDNIFDVFGEEFILRKQSLPSPRGGRIRPDIIGSDKTGNPIIAEIKLLKKRKDASVYWPMRESIGQVIDYAYGYARLIAKTPPSDTNLQNTIKVLRLFIVTEVYAESIENMCQLLRVQGINIEYISIERLRQ